MICFNLFNLGFFDSSRGASRWFYLLLFILIALLFLFLFFGRSKESIDKSSCYSERVSFFRDLSYDISGYTYGSIKTVSMHLPCDYSKICFVDRDVVEQGKEIGINYSLIRSSVNNSAEYNVFLIQGNVVEPAYFYDYLVVDTLDYVCVDKGSKVRFHGREDYVIINPVTDCGDGIIEFLEKCDNGSLNENISAFCSISSIPDGDSCVYCGSGCTNKTYVASCGDGYKNSDEECDDGNFNDSDYCLSTCFNSTCGDTNINPGENCDGSNLGGESCSDFGYDHGLLSCNACSFDKSGCYNSTCDDGTIQLGEECDNGSLNGDISSFCNPTNMNLDGSCVYCGSSCFNKTYTASCGDSYKNSNEECESNSHCDDSDSDTSDVCNSTCECNFISKLDVNISSPLDGSTFYEGSSIHFIANSSNYPTTDFNCSWSSNWDSEFESTSCDFNYSGLTSINILNHTITMEATDIYGRHVSDDIEISVINNNSCDYISNHNGLIVITAEVECETNPSNPRTSNTGNLTVGDCEINTQSSSNHVGDGINENVAWTFDFNSDSNYTNFKNRINNNEDIDAACMYLFFQVEGGRLNTDSIKINEDGYSGLTFMRDVSTKHVPVDLYVDIINQDELAKSYNSSQIVTALTSNNGILPMYYNDDSIIIASRLDLVINP